MSTRTIEGYKTVSMPPKITLLKQLHGNHREVLLRWKLTHQNRQLNTKITGTCDYEGCGKSAPQNVTH